MITKENIIEILKQFEQRDFKNGGVSIAPERYEGIANELLEKINLATAERGHTFIE